MFDLYKLDTKQILLLIFIVLYDKQKRAKCDEDTSLGGYVDAGFQNKDIHVCVCLLFYIRKLYIITVSLLPCPANIIAK